MQDHGDGAPAWLFSFLDLALLMLIAMTQLAQDTPPEVPDLGAMVVPGTGTGAIPVIAKACKEAGLLTIAVVTIPFKSEGKIRIRYAIDGISELKDQVDSLLLINNEKLREIYGDQGVSIAFSKADDVLTTAVKGIAEIITVAGYINVDFADVETVMKDSGVAIMGMGMASGENRALKAIENALASPLLNSNDITGAKSILINISSGSGLNELTMDGLPPGGSSPGTHTR